MGPGAAYAHIAMEQAINDSGLTEHEVSNTRTGLVAGSGGPSTSAMLTAHQTVLKNSSPKRIGPFAVPKCMSSTISANLATAYKIKGSIIRSPLRAPHPFIALETQWIKF